MADRTGRYYEAATAYREKLTLIWQEYENRLATLEKWRGSDGYTEEARKAETKRDTDIKALQKEYADIFSTILTGMKESAVNCNMAAPDAEAINLLTTLKMREKLSREELCQAARTLKDCPAALSVIDEMAAANGFLGLQFGVESTRSVLEHIDSLADSAKRICALNKPNSKREMIAHTDVHSPDYAGGLNAIYSLRVDHDVDDTRDAMAFFGNVYDYDSFAKAVNN